jgi:hypothetical protein
MGPLARWFSRPLQGGALVATLALFCCSALVPQELHKDERLGFKLKAPRGWEPIPLRSDEQWIVGRYRSPKTETTVLEASDYDFEHNPELQIVAFVHRKAAPSKASEDEKDKKPEGEGSEAKKPKPPKVYRDYQEYMRETYGRGHFVEKEESGTQAGLPVTKLEIKAEAETWRAEMRVITWVFSTEVADIAVQIEVMADSLKKHRAEIDDVMKSFAVIPRTKPLETDASEASFLSTVELAKLTPAERKQKKIELQQREWEKITSGLTEGWTASEIDGIYVVNHVDNNFAKKVVEQIQAIYAWLEVNFPEVGKFEYARPPIVRICADGEEEYTFRNGSGSYWEGDTHLVTHKGTKDWWDTEWDYVGARTLGIWFQERDPKLWGALPSWLQIGLDEVVGGARMQSGKLVFKMGDREEWFRGYYPSVNDDSMSVRTLFTLTDDDFSSVAKQDDGKIWWQSVALARFFVESRSKKTRQLLTDYIGNLHLVLSELESKDGKDKDKPPPKNEEEEERQFKQRQEWLKSRERAILDQSLARTFPGWSPADWKNLDREFRRSL